MCLQRVTDWVRQWAINSSSSRRRRRAMIHSFIPTVWLLIIVSLCLVVSSLSPFSFLLSCTTAILLTSFPFSGSGSSSSSISIPCCPSESKGTPFLCALLQRRERERDLPFSLQDSVNHHHFVIIFLFLLLLFKIVTSFSLSPAPGHILPFFFFLPWAKVLSGSWIELPYQFCSSFFLFSR